MIPESTMDALVLVVVFLTVLFTAAFHRSPMGERSIARQVVDWWRSRNEQSED